MAIEGILFDKDGTLLDFQATAKIDRLDPEKFRDPDWTARGEKRASVALDTLTTLWFNTGTLCNLTCRNCYIESSPTNDRLVYLSTAEVSAYLDEIAADKIGPAFLTEVVEETFDDDLAMPGEAAGGL